jgi:hypothetical protein
MMIGEQQTIAVKVRDPLDAFYFTEIYWLYTAQFDTRFLQATTQLRAYDIHSLDDNKYQIHELLLCQCDTSSSSLKIDRDLDLSGLDPLSDLGLVTGLDGGYGDS